MNSLFNYNLKSFILYFFKNMFYKIRNRTHSSLYIKVCDRTLFSLYVCVCVRESVYMYVCMYVIKIQQQALVLL